MEFFGFKRKNRGYIACLIFTIKTAFFFLLASYAIVIVLDSFVFDYTSQLFNIRLIGYILSALGLLTLLCVFFEEKIFDKNWGEEQIDQRTLYRIKFVSKFIFVFLVIFVLAKPFLAYLEIDGSYSVTLSPSDVSRNVELIWGDQGELVGYTDVENKKPDFFLLTKDSLKLNIELPREYTSANVKISYSDSDQEIPLTVGAQHANGYYTEKVVSAYNPILDNLPIYWRKIEYGDEILFQRDKSLEEKYNSIVTENTQKLADLQYNQGQELTALKRLLDMGEIDIEQYNFQKDIIAKTYDSQKIQFDTDAILQGAADTTVFKSIKEFKNEPEKNFIQILALNESIDSFFSLTDSERASTKKIEKLPTLRGRYTLLFYNEKSEPVSFEFKFIDSNKVIGSDDIQIRLSQNQRNIKVQTLYDFTEDSNSELAETPFLFQTNGLDKGLYRLEIVTTDDVFTTLIEPSVNYYAIEGSATFAQSSLYEDITKTGALKITTFYTNARKINFSTIHRFSFQSIKVNQETRALDTIKKQLFFNINETISSITLENGDVLIDSDGVISTSKNNPIMRYRRNINQPTSEEEIGQYDYIIVNYPKTPQRENGWYIGESTFTSPEITFKNREAGFVFDFGDLTFHQNGVKISSITIEFKRSPLTFSKIIDKIGSIF
jgi:hypothetical protein